MALNDQEAQRQIHQMVSFILNEAKEKAQEIDAKTVQEFNIEKLKIVQSMKEKVRNEYKKKLRAAEVERGIALSTAINESRLMKVAAKDQILNEIFRQCQEKLLSLSNDKTNYKLLCTKLIVQGLLTLLDTEVLIKCRETDKSMIQSVLNDAKAQFQSIIQHETDKTMQLKISVDSSFLPPPPSEENVGHSCCGGVVVMTPDHRIVCDNTLDRRLDLVFEQCKPQIRQILFG